AMWLLCSPGFFVRPFHPLARIKSVQPPNNLPFFRPEILIIHPNRCIIVSSKGDRLLSFLSPNGQEIKNDFRSD
ncbi:hypothetical protein, partial [Escherichia coli]|uniref:hypothetical protein n=1 Tax=Escherichia coli TaxID=562 RepID=UPI001A7E0B57